MKMHIGDIRIDPLIDGEILSSPTGAYTNVSEEDWEPHRHHLCGDRVLNTLGGYLVRTSDRTIVVDAGIGPNAVRPLSGGGLRSSLIALGVHASDVTDVVFTHLHFDHIGWASLDGVPFFPNASYRCDSRDWDHYVTADYEPPAFEIKYTNVETDSAYAKLHPVADRMVFFTGDDDILPGLESLDATGHTPGSVVLQVSSGGERGLLLGDLVHSQPELFEENWDFGNHADHAAALESIERIRRKIQDEDLPFAAAHFPGLHWGRLATDKNRLAYHQIT